MVQKLIPSIWFNRNALEAAEFYAVVFPDAKISDVQRYPTEGLSDFQKDFAGEPVTVDIDISGFRLNLINADNHFSPNPSISFLLNIDPEIFADPRNEIDRMWTALTEGGSVLMPLQSYDFSEYYGWCADRFGVHWQLMLTKAEGDRRPFVNPAMLFTGQARGWARQARQKYLDVLSVVGASQEGTRIDYPDSPGTILFSDAQLAGEWVVINDSTFDHGFSFTEGVSFCVLCDGQEQLDAVWAALAVQEQPCGWCKDEFGVSWQVIPANMDELMSKPGAYEKMMGMTKIRINQF